MENGKLFTVRKSPPPSYEEHEQSPNDFISVRKFQNWFDAIAQDDIDSARDILQSTSSQQKQTLLHCPFVYDNLESVSFLAGTLKKDSIKRPVLPVHIAIAFASKQVADLLLKEGSDILAVDKRNRNALHSCIAVSHYLPDREDAACDILHWLKHRIDKDSFTTLLKHENDDGLRPLEYAAQQCCLKIMQEIFNMDQNVKSEKVIGMGHFRLHCVTEYEMGDRHAKSPVNMLTYLDKSKLSDPATVDVLLGPLFTEWIKRKLKCNIIPILLWILIRLSGLIMYMVADLNVHWLEKIHQENSSRFICKELSYINIPDKPYIVLLSVGIVYAIVLLITDVVDEIRAYKMKYNIAAHSLTGRKKVIHSNLFYRCCNLALIICILINMCTYMKATVSGLPPADFLVLINLIRGIVPLLCLSTVIYFFQLIPSIGSSVIQLKGMLTDIAQFMILFLIVLLPFVHVFEVYVLANSRSGCIHEFSSPMMTAYTLFRMMNNMVDTTAVDVSDSGIFYLLHVIYVFIVAIMLINFLIAVMSNTATVISEHKDVMLTVSKLALVMAVENRLFWISKWFYRRIRQRYFHGTDGCVFLLSVKYTYPDKKIKEAN